MQNNLFKDQNLINVNAEFLKTNIDKGCSME
jgi:hypothetical protein